MRIISYISGIIIVLFSFIIFVTQMKEMWGVLVTIISPVFIGFLIDIAVFYIKKGTYPNEHIVYSISGGYTVLVIVIFCGHFSML